MAQKSRMPTANRRATAKGDIAVYISVGSGVAALSLPAGARGGACYVRAAVARRRATLRGATAAAAVAALALTPGCGGGERQDAGEQDARFPVDVPSATFPRHQGLAEHTQMRIVVRNVGDHTIPNLAATIEAGGGGTETPAFGYLAGGTDLSSRGRPVWVVDAGPFGGDTAYANTWAIGALRPHRTKTLVWNVSATRAGHYRLTYRLAGSLTGHAQLRLADGGVPSGSFTVDVTPKPRRVRVTPDGRIVRLPG